jgi:D-alanine-D-alanine ligase
MRVVLFHDEVRPGAPADERDVLVQMDAIAAALAELGHESCRIPCTLNLEVAAKSLRVAKPDVVFNLVESIDGQGRLIHLGPSLLECLHLPFTGCSSAAMVATTCKPLSKLVLHGAHIDTPDWHALDSLSSNTPIVPGKYILKSSWEHASRGLDDASIVDITTPEQLAAALKARLPMLAGDGFAEAYIDGREFNLSILAGEVLPPAEIVFEGFDLGKPRIVGYAAKWDAVSTEYTGTPRRFDFPPGDRTLLEDLRSVALKCWRRFDLRGYARVDFRVDNAGRSWVLEVNANPCLSPDAGFAAAVAQAGLDYREAIRRIVEDARRA